MHISCWSLDSLALCKAWKDSETMSNSTVEGRSHLAFSLTCLLINSGHQNTFDGVAGQSTYTCGCLCILPTWLGSPRTRGSYIPFET